jgi:hypothetical protein
MFVGVRIFIILVFLVIGLSVLATTGTLIYEFWDSDWLALATFYSHLFIFFPIFGIVTLVGFYAPACAFLDMYWRYVPLGRFRFVVGFVTVALLSYVIALQLRAGPERSVFEIRPEVLAADKGEPANCELQGACERLPVITAVENVRRVSQTRIGLSDLARNCTPDPLKGVAGGAQEQPRYCFASTPLPVGSNKTTNLRLTTDTECCQAQGRLVAAVNAMHDDPAQRSLTGVVHNLTLPFKIFFMLMLFTISIMLAFRRKALEQHYAPYLDGIERGVLIGAAAMVIFPVMTHAFLQAAALLYGAGPLGGFRATAPLFSLAFGAWALLLLFYFYGRRDKEIQGLARIGGVIGGAVAIVKYEQIIDFLVRLIGSGAGYVSLAVLGLVALCGILVLLRQTTREMEPPAE